MFAKLIFWSIFLFVLYTYAGYPLLLFLWSKCFPKKVTKTEIKKFPQVSVVIAAKNEEKHIVPRLDNLFAQNYPKEKLEIILVSDGSTDQTEALAQHYVKTANDNHPAFRLIPLDTSRGKPGALNQGVSYAKGEIIVFTDARQKFDTNAIEALVANFSDPAVGCVSGELYFMKDSDSTIKEEMGLYWKIEKIIRKLESAIGSVAGATGAIYAIRKSCYQELPDETLLDDVLTPMNIVLQGFRSVFESRALAYDVPSKNVRQEWTRKVRTLSGNWQLLNIRPALFSPLQNPIWWRFLSHKFFRLLVPFCLPLLLISAILAGGTFYVVLASMQLLFYGMAASGWLFPKTRSNRLVNLCYFFVVLNLAAFWGLVYWLTGNCDKTWKVSPPPDRHGQ